MENSVEPARMGKKKRSQSEKVGRLKHILQKLDRIDGRLGSLDRRLSRIEQGLKPSFVFEKAYIEEVACRDEVDLEILRSLFEAGNSGLLPKEIVAALVKVGLKLSRFQVFRRIVQMNKRLKDKLDEYVAEQRGWHWALTGFVRAAWGESKAGFVAESLEEFKVDEVISESSKEEAGGA